VPEFAGSGLPDAAAGGLPDCGARAGEEDFSGFT
jgi:hypothetical protein